MRKSKLLVVCFLILSFGGAKAVAQNCDIDVVAEAVPTRFGQSTGEVNFKMKDQTAVSDRFIIFDISAARDGASGRLKVEGNTVHDLSVGKYEFLVVDRKREKCAKEILVEIKEQ